MSTPVTIISACLQGVRAVPIRVEVDLLARLPATCIVGLPAHAVRETSERVRSAIEASGFEMPRKRIVVNLSPADARKEGGALDLPIAIGILVASEQLPPPPDGAVFFGELSLGGELRSSRGALAVAMSLLTHQTLYTGLDNARVAELCRGVRIQLVSNLKNVWAGTWAAAPVRDAEPQLLPSSGVDFSDVCGHQPEVENALVEAAETGRPLVFVGPPGCGKSMLARRFGGLLPTLTPIERLETTSLYDAAGLLALGGEPALICDRPFRAPHHSVSVAGLVGGQGRPGEVTLAHNGVLFLDEAPEFSKAALDTVRMPFREGCIRVSTSRGTYDMPSRFRLVAAMNDTPFDGASEEETARYHSRVLKHPLFENAIVVRLERLPPSVMATKTAPRWPATAELRARVSNF